MTLFAHLAVFLIMYIFRVKTNYVGGGRTSCTYIRPKKINILFLISSTICHRAGRLATFFFSIFFFVFSSQIKVSES